MLTQFPLIVAIGLSFIPALVYALIVYALDFYEREPVPLLAGAFGWGAFIATIGSIIFGFSLEQSILHMTDNRMVANIIGPVIVAPVVEESLKGLAVLLIVLLHRRKHITFIDGLVYAGITALGFAATENVFYLFGAYLERGWAEMGFLFVLRVLLGGWNHAAFTAWIGVGCVLAIHCRNPLARSACVMVGWVLAMLLHATHNGLAILLSGLPLDLLPTLAAIVLVDWTIWATVAGVLLWALCHERHTLATYLHEEIALGVLSPAQYQVAISPWAQVAARWRARGNRHARFTDRFYQRCSTLARTKRRCATTGAEVGAAVTIQHLRIELIQIGPLVST